MCNSGRLLRPPPQDITVIETNVERIAAMERKALVARSPGARLIDVIVGLGGTPLFGLCHVVWFGCWIVANVVVVKGLPTFDPYPFPFLTFVVSLEAIFLSIAVLISENDALRLAERRANLDLQVNLLAEQESTATLRLVRQIAEHMGVTAPSDRKGADLAAETDVQDVLDQLERHLPKPV
jgi:uncharacterized membrane protein